jgi:DNA adenine methylase
MSYQLPLLDYPTTMQVVNVASVPQRSPFRYPGGKTWLVPRIRQWLTTLSTHPHEFIEPFAGGGIIGLTVAFEQLAGHVLLVEIDEQVGALWQALIEDECGEWLAEQIERFALSSDNVQRLLSQTDLPLAQRALQTIIHNRVSRGGILAKGAGLVKYGENGKGLASRWYPQTLSKRLRAIHQIRQRLSFVWGDGMKIIEQYLHRADVIFFIDPPYTAAGHGKNAGHRLYNHAIINHAYLFELMEHAQGDFLMTYDNHPEIYQMATRHGFEAKAVAMKNTHHARMTELLISRDLRWLV